MTLREVAVDTEGTGLYPWAGDRAFSWGFADADGWTDYVEFPVDPYTREVSYKAANSQGWEAVRSILSDPNITKVYFNAKYDIRMSEFAGFRHEGPIEEVSFAIKLVGVERPWWKLKPFAKRTFDFPTDDEKQLKSAVNTLRGRAKMLGWKLGPVAETDYWMIAYAEEIMVGGLKTLKSYKASSPSQRAKLRLRNRLIARELKGLCESYNVQDAERTILGWQYAKEVMEKIEVTHIYNEEMKLWPAVYAMQGRGMYVDPKEVQRGSLDAIIQEADALAKLKKLTGRDDYKPGSSKMKTEYFIDQLGLEPLKLTPKANPSIDAAFHEHYAETVPACRETVRFVKSQKAKSSYYDHLFLAQSDNNVIHPDLNQFGTLTGRFTGRFLTIPKRLPEGDVMLGVRKSITPRPGHVFYCADYKQIEARIYADEFQEETLLGAFAENTDPYDHLKDEIINKTGAPVSRDISKQIFLGKIYGLGSVTMCGQICDLMAAQGELVQVDLADAEEIVYAFNETFPGVSAAMKSVQRQAKSDGYVMNRQGQKIRIDRDFAYKGVNYIIQSTAAQLMKRAMGRCHRYLKKIGCGWLVLTIHDELVFEFKKRDCPVYVLRKLKTIMEDQNGLFEVSTPVDFDKCEKNWLEREPYKWAP